jgi:hypothetical protein
MVTLVADKQKGRPSDYTQEMADAICEALSEGKSLRKICEPEDMPNRAAVFRWLSKDEDFRNQYAHAREEQAEALADDIIAIADGKGDDLLLTSEINQRDKLRVDARKWVASKLKPKKYGDKIQTEVSGKDGGPIESNVTIDPTKLSTQAMSELLNAATNKE